MSDKPSDKDAANLAWILGTFAVVVAMIIATWKPVQVNVTVTYPDGTKASVSGAKP